LDDAADASKADEFTVRIALKIIRERRYICQKLLKKKLINQKNFEEATVDSDEESDEEDQE
jgi:hypothetical protein